MTLEELLYKLKNLKYTSDLLGKKTEFSVLNNENFGAVENLIREYALDNHDSEMGELKAKLYVYEQIIAKSNFAPMLKDGNERESKITGINWQYTKNPNEINEAIKNHDENWEGLTSAEQIKSITYDSNQGCYVVFWVA